MRKTIMALFALAAVGLVQPTVASARGGGGGARREMELMRPWNSLRCYLYAFCNCLPQRSN